MLATSVILGALVDPDQWWVKVLPAVGVILIIVGLRIGMVKRRRRVTDSLTARERLEQMNQKRAVHGDLERLMVEIDELARHLGSQLDAKTIAVEKAVQEADQRIELLRRLLEQSSPSVTAERSVAGDDSQGSPAVENGSLGSGVTPQQQALAQRVYDLADRGVEPIEIARQLGEGVGKVELILALRSV